MDTIQLRYQLFLRLSIMFVIKKGSHVHLRHPIRRPLTVPMHTTIAKGTLKEIIKAAGLAEEEFTELLKK